MNRPRLTLVTVELAEDHESTLIRLNAPQWLIDQAHAVTVAAIDGDTAVTDAVTTMRCGLLAPSNVRRFRQRGNVVDLDAERARRRGATRIPGA
ncbi:MAG TPA: hypothetical protein VM450_00220 [Thermomicrobiales bacterium]|nr:hypothetical protein [Thermomicrobiales bacterium]